MVRMPFWGEFRTLILADFVRIMADFVPFGGANLRFPAN
jgi:hypothetical protein